MIIDMDHKIVFLSNAKVASTSMEIAIAKAGRKIGRIGGVPKLTHVNYKIFLKIAEPLALNDFTTVAVVRHPFDKAVSWYTYRSRDEIKGSPRYLGDISFDDYIDDLINKKSRSRRAGVQDKYFVECKKTGRRVDLIFKYDQLNDFLYYLKKLYGDKFNFKSLNTSPKKNIDQATFEQCKARFYEAFKDDIEWYEALRSPVME